MERLFKCSDGHAFKVFDNGEESDEDHADVDFGIPCPLCGSTAEIHWPSNRAFKIAAN